MGPDEMEQIITFEPFVPFRMTLASGDKVEVRSPEGAYILGLSLALASDGMMGQPRLQLVSLPNIAMVEPLPWSNRLEDTKP